MSKRQGHDDFGLNLQMPKDNTVEIQKDFYVVIFVESAANRLSLGRFAIRRDEKLPLYSRLELRSRLCKLGLRQSPIVILVEFCKARCVVYGQRQDGFQTVRALSYR